MHVQTSGCTLTAQQPLSNITRVTIQALAAVLGGTQSLHTNSFDEALCLPTEEAVRVALRTQQIIAHESGAADTIDPLAGSCCIEYLTNEMEKQAMGYIQRIDDMGGAIAAIEKGFFQKEIADSAYKYQRETDEKKRIIVGLNEYTTKEATSIPILRIDPKVEDEQVSGLQKLRRERDNRKVEEALEKLLFHLLYKPGQVPFQVLASVKRLLNVGFLVFHVRAFQRQTLDPFFFPEFFAITLRIFLLFSNLL